jgi:hypothetical protein
VRKTPGFLSPVITTQNFVILRIPLNIEIGSLHGMTFMEQQESILKNQLQ